MKKTPAMADDGLAAIEKTQRELQTSIEVSKELAAKAERLLAQHRQHLEQDCASGRDKTVASSNKQ